MGKNQEKGGEKKKTTTKAKYNGKSQDALNLCSSLTQE